MGRVKLVSKDEVDTFLTVYKTLLMEHQYESDFIINADESPCNFTNVQSYKILASAKAKKQGTINTPKSQLRTILPFVAASGRVWMTVLIYKDVTKTDTSKDLTVPVTTELRLTRSTMPTYYATTANGFITSELWKQIIDRLVERISAFKRGQRAILLVDRHSTHLDLSSVKSLVDSGIQPLYLPAHTTHLLQPLDDVIFGAFKRRVHQKKALESLRRLLTGESLNSIIEDIITEEKSNVFDKATIQAGFKHTGMWPFDENEIRKKFEDMYAWSKTSHSDSTDNMSIQSMVAVIKDSLLADITKTATKRVRVNERNKVMTGQQLIDYTVEKEEKAKKEAEEKEVLKKEKEEKKRKREEEKLERQELTKKRKLEKEQKVLDRTCSNCSKIYRANHRFWTCDHCDSFQACLFCQEDDDITELHLDQCAGRVNDSENCSMSSSPPDSEQSWD